MMPPAGAEARAERVAHALARHPRARERSRRSARCSTRWSRGRPARIPTPTTSGSSTGRGATTRSRSASRPSWPPRCRGPGRSASRPGRRRAPPTTSAASATRCSATSSCAGATSSASRASSTPTTPCSTTSSPASRPPSCARCSPSCATRSCRSWPPPATPSRRATTAPCTARSASTRSGSRCSTCSRRSASTRSRGGSIPTLHPFAAGIAPDDVRLTTKYDESDFAVALYSALHEFGHGLYEAQVDPQLFRTTLDDPVSLGVHESQSRMWENLVGRSRPFCAWMHPRLAEWLPGAVDGLDATGLYRAVNTVQPSLIRTEADETTYNLHIILRFELELALIEGSLSVDDLPAAWDEGMERLLGIEVPTVAEGVLQDVHWSTGPVRLLPDLHAREPDRLAAVGAHRRGPAGPRRAAPARRVRAAARVAARARPPPRAQVPAARAAAPDHRRRPARGALPALFAREAGRRRHPGPHGLTPNVRSPP